MLEDCGQPGHYPAGQGRRVMRKIGLVLVGVALVGAGLAANPPSDRQSPEDRRALAIALTQLQQDRLNEVSKFVVTSPICQSLGMRLDPSLADKAELAVGMEIASWRADPATAKRMKDDAISRQGAILRTDLKAAVDGAKTETQLRALKDILIGYGRVCLAATTDPVFSSLIVAPPEYDLNKAATDAADSMLEAGGLASWQTPQIRARGDLMMLAGTCRSKIGAARSDALVKEFGRSDDARVRDYYSNAFDEGLADPSIISTLAGCNKVIAAYRSKVQ